MLSMYDQAHEQMDEEKLCYPVQTEISNTFSRYEEPVASFEGGVKMVHKVHDKINGRYVALATLKDQSDPEALERFLSEARLTSALQHPNIMPIYDMGYDDKGVGYFTMKFITGDNLAVILKELKKQNPNYIKHYSLPALLEIFNKICDAIAYAHANNVLHLDLKPANIQVGNFGEVIVCDWGLAKVVHEHDRVTEGKVDLDALILNDLTLNGMLKGTPGYMAPEQIDGNIAAKSYYSDIYSLGVILYQILTRKLPVEGDSLKEVLEHTKRGKVTPPNELSTQLDVPESLSAVCMKALRLNPTRRYQSVIQLKSEVEAYLNGFATEAQNASFWQQLRLLLKRNKSMAIATASFIFLLLAFTGIFFNRLAKKEKAARTLANTLQAEKVQREKAHKLYRESVERNLESLKLYEYEKMSKEKALDYLYGQADYFFRRNDFRNTKVFCEKALAASPCNPRFSELLAKCYLTQQWIPVAVKAMENYDFEHKDEFIDKLIQLQKLREKNGYDYKDQGRKFSRKDLLKYGKVLHEFGFTGIMQKTYYNKPHMPVTKEYQPLLEYMLKFYNPQVKNLNIKVESVNGQSKLDLSNNKALVDITALHGFEISILNLSKTSVSNLKEFTHKLKITEIDISHTNFINLVEIRKMKNLHKLTVHKGQFPKELLESISEQMQIIILLKD